MNKVVKALLWIAIIVFSLVVITDGLCLIGLKKAWQYLFNAFFFVLFLPSAIALISRDKTNKF